MKKIVDFSTRLYDWILNGKNETKICKKIRRKKENVQEIKKNVGEKGSNNEQNKRKILMKRQ